MRGLVRDHAGVRLLQGGATTRTTYRVGDSVDTSGASLSLGYVARVVSVALAGQRRPLMIVIQILTTLVDV